MSEEKFITNQKELAAAVNRTPEHLSGFKNRLRGPSDDMIERLHKVTGIKMTVLFSASPKKLDKAFKAFFKEQRMRKMLSM